MAVINRIVVNAGERVVIECISSSAPALITLGSDAKGPLTAFTQSSIYRVFANLFITCAATIKHAGWVSRHRCAPSRSMERDYTHAITESLSRAGL
jgi:hypothetical protein